MECIDSIESTIGDIDYEIILVDDCSDVPVKIDGIRIIRQMIGQGIGSSFDLGVTFAQSDNIILTACDVRFTNNDWALKMLAEIRKHPKSLICTAVIPLQKEFPELDFASAKKFLRLDAHKGATIKLFMGDDENPHHIIEASWNPREFLPLRSPDYKTPTECYEVHCILGACYGVSKHWYQHIDGFWGHRFWGTLEPLISLKSWMFGGSCLVAPFIETAHYFKNTGTCEHGSLDKYHLYKTHNRLLVCELLFPQPLRNRLIRWLPKNDVLVNAKRMIKENDEIEEKRLEYREKTIFKMKDIITKFNLQ
jgi:glycosyltransferase involved in cell wall biosynthesis